MCPFPQRHSSTSYLSRDPVTTKARWQIRFPWTFNKTTEVSKAQLQYELTLQFHLYHHQISIPLVPFEISQFPLCLLEDSWYPIPHTGTQYPILRHPRVSMVITNTSVVVFTKSWTVLLLEKTSLVAMYLDGWPGWLREVFWLKSYLGFWGVGGRRGIMLSCLVPKEFGKTKLGETPAQW